MGCAAEEVLPVSAQGVVSVAPAQNVPARPVVLSIVLPPADSIEPSELARVRLLVERALGEVGPWKGHVEVLEPSDSMAQLGSVELAARRSSDVCVLGVAAPQVVASVRQLYPALRECLLTAVSSDPGVTTAMPGDAATTNPVSPMTTIGTTNVRASEGSLRAEVELGALGAELGRSARAVAGDELVVVLDGGDPMFDRGWVPSIATGARPGPVDIVRDAGAVLELIAQLELIDERIGAVVLDASAGASELAARLLEQGVPVIGPRSILADSGDHPALVARWRVRWDVPLAVLFRALANVGPASSVPSGPATSTDPVGVIEPGPAFRALSSER